MGGCESRPVGDRIPPGEQVADTLDANEDSGEMDVRDVRRPGHADGVEAVEQRSQLGLGQPPVDEVLAVGDAHLGGELALLQTREDCARPRKEAR